MTEEKKETPIEFKLGKDETLRCDSCSKYLHDQMVYLDVDDGINEVMCRYCWKQRSKGDK